MKKISLIIFSVLTICNYSFGQIKYGINAAFGLCNGTTIQPLMNGSSTIPIEKKLVPALKLGVVCKIPMSTTFFLMPELNIVHKGTRIVVKRYNNTYYQTVDSKYSLTFLELPLNIAYTGKKNRGFIIGGGPVISMGLGGKLKTKDGFKNVLGEVENINQKIVFDGKASNDISENKDYHLKRLEMGFDVFVSQMLTKSVYLKASYFRGFTNLQPDSKYKLNINYVAIGCMIFFNSKGGKSEK